MGKMDIIKAMRHKNILGAGATMRRKLHNPNDKMVAVMKEFGRGTLHSGSGNIVTNRKQAIAIGLSEAGLSKNMKRSAHGSGPFSMSALRCGYKVR